MKSVSRGYFVTLLALLAGLPTGLQAAPLRIAEVTPLAGGKVRISASGSSPEQVALQSTADFRAWTTLQTFPPNTAAISYTDTTGGTRFYRLSVGSAPVLGDLAALPNRVFPAPESLNTIQFAPDGKLAFIAWRDQSLIIRERNLSGAWSEHPLNNAGNTFALLTNFVFNGPRDDYRFQPSAALLYDSQSRPHVFMAAGTTIIHYSRNASGAWAETARIPNPNANASISVLQAALGPGDTFHFTALSSGSLRNLTYGTNRGGSWLWTTISTVTDADPYYWPPPFAPRWLSFAVDQNNAAHIAYRSSMDITKHAAGYPRARSVLKYASNASGSWIKDRIVQDTFDISGEAANGASIAIAPDNKPRIVSWYNERADTGSSQESRLYFHQQDAAGNWTKTIIATAPDGYIAGDGPKGAGFSPTLRYDQRGRAHILFLDHAGQHFSAIGQQEYAGNLRHAWSNGASWSFETIHRQTDPLKQQAIYPAFATFGDQLAVTFLERSTLWNLATFPPISDSTYKFRFLTRTLP